MMTLADENAELRKENARLRRENESLKATNTAHELALMAGGWRMGGVFNDQHPIGKGEPELLPEPPKENPDPAAEAFDKWWRGDQ